MKIECDYLNIVGLRCDDVLSWTHLVSTCAHLLSLALAACGFYHC